MAFTPCAWHGKGYAGAASTFFLRVVDGYEQTGGRLQVCPNCATEVLDKLASTFQKVSEGDDFYDVPESFACSSCFNPLDGSTSKFYGNAYPRGKRESQWYGSLCNACVPAVAEDLHLHAATRRP